MNIAIMCNTKSSEYPNRPELIQLLVNRGHTVYFGVINDGSENEYFKRHKRVKCLKILATRDNTNPIKELASLVNIKSTIKANKIDCAIIYGIKNHPAMAIGSKLGGAKKIICIVNGRGNLFTAKGVKGIVLRTISFPLLRLSYAISRYVCFQNTDDSIILRNKHLVKEGKIILMNGSGVNLIEYPERSLPCENRFLYLARITPSKGVQDFIEASKLVKEAIPDAIFDIVGPIDDLVEGSCKQIIQKAEDEHIINYHGKTNDVQGWMRKSRFFVYPSYYPEGVPRCVLQAMATGRPIITCNSSGCRETVENDLNGILVEPHDIEALSKAMIMMASNKDLAESMGRQSRRLAELKFDVDKINNQLAQLAED